MNEKYLLSDLRLQNWYLKKGNICNINKQDILWDISVYSFNNYPVNFSMQFLQT